MRCIIGVSTSRNPRSSRKGRMPLDQRERAIEDLRATRVGDQVEVALAVAARCRVRPHRAPILPRAPPPGQTTPERFRPERPIRLPKPWALCRSQRPEKARRSRKRERVQPCSAVPGDLPAPSPRGPAGNRRSRSCALPRHSPALSRSRASAGSPDGALGVRRLCHPPGGGGQPLRGKGRRSGRSRAGGGLLRRNPAGRSALPTAETNRESEAP